LSSEIGRADDVTSSLIRFDTMYVVNLTNRLNVINFAGLFLERRWRRHSRSEYVLRSSSDAAVNTGMTPGVCRPFALRVRMVDRCRCWAVRVGDAKR